MKKSPLRKLLIVLFIILGLFLISKMSGLLPGDGADEVHLRAKNNVLRMDLRGIILNGKKFIKNLGRYSEEHKIKAILIDINSPGGAVGPSQEIYAEIKRTRSSRKIPVVCYSNGLLASGAYYVASACDKIVVAPGALVGSIGVILQFVNLEKLYDWAKISRFSITSGKYKDSGAEYRTMREDERALFQGMIDEVYQQFRSAVRESRSLTEEVLNEYADGRVFSGTTAVQTGFADQVGTFHDALQATAQLANLGEDYELYEIPKAKKSIFDWAEGEEEDPVNSDAAESKSHILQLLNIRFQNQPMLLMPGIW